MSRATAPRVVVIGSANLDRVLHVERIPAPGETVAASHETGGIGGKGCNQAIAAARSGATVGFVGAVGADGDVVVDMLAAENVQTVLTRSRTATGSATVLVDPHGENSIVVLPGANGEWSGLSPDARRLLSAAEVAVFQAELRPDLLAEVMAESRRLGVRTVLNASPLVPEIGNALASVDILVVNEGEGRMLLRQVAGPHGYDTPEAIVTGLLPVVPVVVMTLGARGVVFAAAADGGTPRRVPAIPATVADTTGAGDTFCGVLAAELAARVAMDEAVLTASIAAGLAVERYGAAASVPYRAEIERRRRVLPVDHEGGHRT